MTRSVELARKRNRKTPKPKGDEQIVYGDKVINVSNHRRYKVYPKEGATEYVANGEIGIVVGQFKGPNFPKLPWALQVEFSSQPVLPTITTTETLVKNKQLNLNWPTL